MEAHSFRIVARGDGYLVVAKLGGFPTVPLAGGKGGYSMLEELGLVCPEVLAPMGHLAHEGGVLHRLDTDTCGLVLVAADRDVYRRLSASQRLGSFFKTYVAGIFPGPVAEGFPPCPYRIPESGSLRIESRFRPYGKGRRSVRPVVASSFGRGCVKTSEKDYVTDVASLGFGENGERLVSCTLAAGFRHQVRCHLAWTGNPISGDAVYGGRRGGALHLAAISLRFPEPGTGEPLDIVWRDAPAWTVPTHFPPYAV